MGRRDCRKEVVDGIFSVLAPVRSGVRNLRIQAMFADVGRSGLDQPSGSCANPRGSLVFLGRQWSRIARLNALHLNYRICPSDSLADANGRHDDDTSGKSPKLAGPAEVIRFA